MSDFKSVLDVETLASGNPRVNRDKFADGQAAIAKLRRAGLERPSYDISSPYERGGLVMEPEAATDDSASGEVFPG